MTKFRSRTTIFEGTVLFTVALFGAAFAIDCPIGEFESDSACVAQSTEPQEPLNVDARPNTAATSAKYQFATINSVTVEVVRLKTTGNQGACATLDSAVCYVKSVLRLSLRLKQKRRQNLLVLLLESA